MGKGAIFQFGFDLPGSFHTDLVYKATHERVSLLFNLQSLRVCILLFVRTSRTPGNESTLALCASQTHVRLSTHLFDVVLSIGNNATYKDGGF
jgi:hypothetical protein